MRRWILLGILAALVTALSAVPTIAGGQTNGLEQAMAVQDAHTGALLDILGVEGTGVSLDANGDPVVVIFTEHPSVAGLPGRLDGFNVQVRVTGKITALHHRPGHDGGPGNGGGVDPTSRFDRPAPIGVSSGNENDWYISGPFIVCSGGTLGARLVDDKGNINPDDDVYYALSNNHVYARENAAANDENILQPGLLDTNCSSDTNDIIAQLSDFEPIIFNNTDPGAANYCDPANLPDPDCNTIDAAIAETTTADVGNSTPSDGYGTPSSTTVAASVGQTVQKYGRTTSLTTGEVTAINATVDTGYNSGTARFVNQIMFTDISQGGDSGSLIVTNDSDNNPAALLFAGSSFVTIGNPIGLVLAAFSVTVDGQDSPPPTGGDFTLTATGYKEKGLQKADLDWLGAAANGTVDIIRDGVVIDTAGTSNGGTGSYTDNIDQRGGGSYIYQVCEQGTSTCSNEATVTF